MKKMFFSLILITFLSLNTEAHRYKSLPFHFSISVQMFYDELSPYGDWIYSSDYGYVWRPEFDYPEAFRPYSSNGRWVYTDLGWTWVSDYRWGWATFHYGRWYMDDYLGWLWVPGYDWAPAWVAWGSYDGYWGWAPLSPGFYVGYRFDNHIPSGWWTFVHGHHFCSSHWNHYIYDRPVNVVNITNITNIYNDNSGQSNSSWYHGPRIGDVERHSRTRVPRMDIVNSDVPENKIVSERQMRVYRPSIEKNEREARPAEFRNADNVRRAERFQPQAAIKNDPGKNRVREDKINPSKNTGTVQPGVRTEPRAVSNNRSSGTNDVSNDRNTRTEQKSDKPRTESNRSREPKQNVEQRTPAGKGSVENVQGRTEHREPAVTKPKQEAKTRSTEQPAVRNERNNSNQNSPKEIGKSSTHEKPKSVKGNKPAENPQQKTQPVKQAKTESGKKKSEPAKSSSVKTREKNR